MGYTHYWYRPLELPRDKWSAFLSDWTKVYDALIFRGIVLIGSAERLDDPPVMNRWMVAFNGDPAYEDFLLARTYESPHRMKEDGRCFSFCKTQMLPYDLSVTSCLLVAKHHFGDLLIVGSDGDDSGWQAARELCEGVLGYGRAFHIADDPGTHNRVLIECRAPHA